MKTIFPFPRSLSLFFLAFFFVFSAGAHEGHDKTPGNLAAPNGGKIKGTSQFYVELVSNPNGFKAFITDHDMKPVNPKDVQATATFKLPKQKVAQPLALAISDNSFESRVDAKGAHRYALEIQLMSKGKTEKVTFNVEP